MSNKLQVLGIPQKISLDQFREKFQNFQGFINSDIKYDQNGMALHGELTYQNVQNADYVKKVMNGFIFPGSSQRINIDFMKLSNQPNQQQQQIQQHVQQQNQMKGYNPLGDNLNQQQHQQPQHQYNQNQQFQPQQRQVPQGNNMPPINKQQQFTAGNSNMSMPHIQQQPPNNSYMGNAQGNMGGIHIGGGQNMSHQMPHHQNPQVMQQQQQIGGGGGHHEEFGGMIASMINNNTNNQQMNLNFQQNNPNQDVALFKIPPDATDSLYVDGIPIDAEDREVAHIFRPFPGFQAVRLIKKKTATGRPFYYCFVDFENPLQSTIALKTLQGYRFDKNDKKGIKISYANEPSQSKKDRRR